MSKQKKITFPFSHAVPLVIVLLVILGASAQLTLALDAYYSVRVAPGVSLGIRDLSNLEKEKAAKVFEEYIERLQQNGIPVSYGSERTVIFPYALPADSDAPHEGIAHVFTYDSDETMRRIFESGHSRDFLTRMRDIAIGTFVKKRVVPAISVNGESLKEALRKELGSYESPSKTPSYIYSNNNLTVSDGVAGKEFDFKAALSAVETSLQALERPEIKLALVEQSPDFSPTEMLSLKPAANALLPIGPLTLTSETHTFILSKETLTSFLIPKRLPDSRLTVQYDEGALSRYLEEEVAPKVRVQAEEPKFAMKDGLIIPLESSVQGKELDMQISMQALLKALVEDTQEVSLVIKESPHPSASNTAELRVTEVVAEAKTNFKGSPTNRRKNIAVGIEKMNGLLVAPEEEFSLIKALGAIEKENGFLPELVIKGNKTTPEYGGGLCQVSTTLFRAVTHAGLPILERKNHSYRVSYYEPPVGFDATIYYPKPDFRFKNDTGSHLLIQAKVSGTIAHVVLWGTKDGRVVEVDEPTVFNIKKAGEAKIIETTDLKPGEKKCTERAHNGADAYFERRVTYPSGELKKETFKSHYVVWPAVCLVGKQPDTPSGSTSTPSSTVQQ